MNEIDQQRFQRVYERFEAGDRVEALVQLRELAGKLEDPWDKTALLYHELLFLIEMNQVAESRRLLEEFKKALASLGGPLPDAYEDDLPHNLSVMLHYTELRVLLAEEEEPQALRVVEDLLSSYTKQLSVPGFREILDEINTYRGFLLADVDRWEEAKPFLENASPPETWKGVACYYLGHCFYVFGDYGRARTKLLEALNLGMEARWEKKARYVLGIVEYHLSNMKAAKDQFEMCLKLAPQQYIGASKNWEWLEAASRSLGLYDEAERYRKRRTDPPTSMVN